MRFGTKLREVKGNAEILESCVRVFIESPHCLRGIDRRASADCDDPVGLGFSHCRGAGHNSINGRVRLNAFEKLDFHSGFFQVINSSVQKAKTLHAAAADNDESLFTGQILQFINCTFSVVKVSG